MALKSYYLFPTYLDIFSPPFSLSNFLFNLIFRAKALFICFSFSVNLTYIRHLY